MTDIHPVWIRRISKIYVDVYKSSGFVAAKEYLARVTKGDKTLTDFLVPFIVAEGEQRK